MMGRQATKRELFVSISLDEYVPEDHLLRAVSRYLDLGEFRQCLADSYSHTGRSSIDPELIARMLIIGCSYGISSERHGRNLDCGCRTGNIFLLHQLPHRLEGCHQSQNMKAGMGQEVSN